MREKSLKDISWQVSEDEYRQDPSLSYSTIATYKRSGFEGLDQLYERKDTPSLTFGSAVDALITGGESEFNDRFIVADFPDIPDAIIKIVKACFDLYASSYRNLTDIPDSNIITIAANFSYQNNWKPETRAKVIREKGEEYYQLLFLSENKTILTSTTYTEVLAAVRALRESEATKFMFQPDDPFDDSIERLYQLKFKATLDGVDYRCMSDLLIVDYNKKIIYPKDLKTSSHYEYDFYKSFIQWDYQIQARLYWRIIRDNLYRDPYFKSFTLADYEFVVVNKKTLNPLVWEFKFTTSVGTLYVGKNAPHGIELRDPEELGKELNHYLKTRPIVPDGIKLVGSNDLIEWINKYE